MKTLAQSSAITVLLLFRFCVAQEPDATLQELFERFHRLQTEQCSDNARDDPLLFASVDLTKLTEDEKRAVERLARKAIARWEKYAKRPFPGLTPTQRKNANQRLKARDFEVDSRITKSDVAAIVKYFMNHPPLDPRIISLKFVDENTIRIMTGVIRGPLDGEGEFYVARRENGRWVVRSDGGWIS